MTWNSLRNIWYPPINEQDTNELAIILQREVVQTKRIRKSRKFLSMSLKTNTALAQKTQATACVLYVS